jgi:hypothetical protein
MALARDPYSGCGERDHDPPETLRKTELNAHIALPTGVEILGQVTPEYVQTLTPEAMQFVAKLHWQFEPRRREFTARQS